MKIRKEVKLNENVYTLYNILEILYHHYLSTDIPKELLEELKKVYDRFYDEVVKDYVPEVDIVENELVEKIVFKGDDNSYTYPKEKISYYDLMTMYKDGITLPDKIKLSIGSRDVVYTKCLDIDDSFIYYTIENESEINESEGVMEFMSDCLLDSNCLKKIIQIIE